MVLPPTVAGVALLVAFGRRSVIGSTLSEAGLSLAFTTAAVVLAQLFVSAPFLVRSLQAGFEEAQGDVDDPVGVEALTRSLGPPRNLDQVAHLLRVSLRDGTRLTHVG